MNKKSKYEAPNSKILDCTPSRGATREEDVARRDRAAKLVQSIDQINAPELVVNLHASVDDKTIKQCIKRWKGSRAKFQIDESDSTPEERIEFLQRWLQFGGPLPLAFPMFRHSSL